MPVVLAGVAQAQETPPISKNTDDEIIVACSRKFNSFEAKNTTPKENAIKGDDDSIIIHISENYIEVVSANRLVTYDTDIKSFNTITLEDHLNTLPVIIPGMTAFSNNPGDGTVSVDLRGLGTQRTLVLVNSQRFVETGGEGRIDLNAIPAALIKKIVVDTNTGSAIYGSGAMTGIVNIQLDDDFIGNEIGASYEISSQGDAAKSSIYLKFGRDFNDGHGQAMVFANYSKRNGIFASERDFSIQGNVDIGTGFTAFGSSGVPGTRLFDGFDFTNAGYTTDGTNCAAPNNRSSEGLSGTCQGGATFDTNGNITPWINTGENTTRYNNAPFQYLQLPQDRYSLAAFGHYDIADNVDLKLSSIFTSNKVPTQLAPTPFFSTVTLNLDTNPFLTPQSRATLMATAISGGQSINAYQVFIGRRMTEVGPRRIEREKQTLHLAADLGGDLSSEWSWDIHGHYSRETQDAENSGAVSISAMPAAVFSGQCNIFGADLFSNQCVDLVSRNSLTETAATQYNIQGTVQGSIDFLQSPKATDPMQVLLGAECRKDQYETVTDSILNNSTAGGFNEQAPFDGTQNSTDLYGEMYWPIVQEVNGIDELSLSATFSYSELSGQGNTSLSRPGRTELVDTKNNGHSSYSMGADWAPISDVRFHIGYDNSFRQPSLKELFSPQTNGFSGAFDPCAFQFVTSSPAYGNRDLCIANGVPVGAYSTGLFGGLIEELSGGNPSLKPETSKTFTMGMAVTPDIADSFEFSIQYQNTNIDHIVGSLPIQLILDRCFVGGELSFCDRVNRFSSGTLRYVDLTSGNFLSKKMEVIDFAVHTNFDIPSVLNNNSEATFSINFLASLQLENATSHPSIDITRPLSNLQNNFFDCTGYHDAEAGFCGEPLPKWKHTADITYSDWAWALTARWRYSSSTKNDQLSPQAVGTFTQKFAFETGAKYYFDLSGQWDISKTINISAGLINIFDTKPPIFGRCCSEQANTFPSSYGPIGRKFFIAARANF